jgi:uncharacterized protein DUF2313
MPSGAFSPAAFSPTAFSITADSEPYAQMLMALLPPGRLWKLIGSTLADFFRGCADELARFDLRIGDFLNELDPSTATELLPEYERELGLVAAPTVAERRANVVARLVRRQGFRPADFQQALAPLLAQDPSAVVVLERSLAYIAAAGDQREIYQFFIYRDPTLPGTYFLASAQALVAGPATQSGGMKPSHTEGFVIESVSAVYDDPHSVYDRDLYGA